MSANTRGLYKWKILCKMYNYSTKPLNVKCTWTSVIALTASLSLYLILLNCDIDKLGKLYLQSTFIYREM